MEAQFCLLDGQVSQTPLILKVAGRTVHWRCQDAELSRQLLRPLAHLQMESGTAPELEIEILAQPAQPVADGVFFDFSPDGRFAGQRLPRSFSLFRRQPAKIIASYQPPELLSLYELGRPLHAMLSLWLNQMGAPLVHAGMVAVHGRGLLVAGPSGAGKTTTCLSALHQKQRFLGDDMVALDESFWAFSLYATTFLLRAEREKRSWLGPEYLEPRYPWEDKTLTYLYPRFSDQLLQCAAVDELLLPGRQALNQQLPPIQALLGLAPSSLLVGPLSAGQCGLELLSRLVARVPCRGWPWGSNLC